MKKILIYITTLGGGGAERVLINLLKQVNSSKYDITVTTLTNSGVHTNSIPDYVKYKSIIHNTNPRFEKCWTYICYKIIPPRLFHTMFLRGKYDIEIAYLPGYPSKIIQSSSKKFTKKICFIHGNVGQGEMFKHVYGSLKKAKDMYKLTDVVCFVSEKNMQVFENVLGHVTETRVLHNVIDVTAILEKSKVQIDTGYGKDTVNLVSVGRLAQPKGYLRLLRLVKELKENDLKFTLTIIGEGEQKEELQNYILENGLDNVRILPFQTNPFPYISCADLFICSSYSEGYSTAVSEAAILGTPVITTECDGMSEIFFKGVGARIVNNSDEALFESLFHCLKNEDIRKNMKEEATYFSKVYIQSVQSNIKNYEHLFDSI